MINLYKNLQLRLLINSTYILLGQIFISSTSCADIGTLGGTGETFTELPNNLNIPDVIENKPSILLGIGCILMFIIGLKIGYSLTIGDDFCDDHSAVTITYQ